MNLLLRNMNFVTEFEERVDKVEKQLDRLEELMVDIKVSLNQNQLKFDEQFLKMMQGFKCIQKAFRMNCDKQFDLHESIDDLISFGLHTTSI